MGVKETEEVAEGGEGRVVERWMRGGQRERCNLFRRVGGEGRGRAGKGGRKINKWLVLFGRQFTRKENCLILSFRPILVVRRRGAEGGGGEINSCLSILKLLHFSFGYGNTTPVKHSDNTNKRQRKSVQVSVLGALEIRILIRKTTTQCEWISFYRRKRKTKGDATKS